MEPSLDRPRVVTALAFFAGTAAICYFTCAFVGFATRPDRESTVWLSALALYGVLRIAAMYGLLRMKRYAAILEIVSAVVWVVPASNFFLYIVLQGTGLRHTLRETNSPSKFIALSVFVIAAVSLPFALYECVYLGRPSMRRRMAGRGAPAVPVKRASWIAIGSAVAAVTAVLTIVIAPQMITAVVRSRQKRTMAFIRDIGDPWEARAKDLGRYNSAAMLFPTNDVPVDMLFKSLSPTYAKTLPRTDAWGNGWQLAVSAPWSGSTPAQEYMIISYGKDGRSDRKWAGGYTTDFDCDIVWSNGVFVQSPYGLARQ